MPNLHHAKRHVIMTIAAATIPGVGCGALLLIPDLLATPGRIDGCPTVALLPGQNVELTFVVVRADEDDSDPPGIITWSSASGVVTISDENANPVTVVASQVGFATINAVYSGAAELVDSAQCIIGVVPDQPQTDE